MQPVPFFCPQCTDPHFGIPAIVLGRPDAIAELSRKPGLHAIDEGTEICRIKHPGPRQSFIRAIFTVPVHDSAADLEYGAWIRLPEPEFLRYRAHSDRHRNAVAEFEGTLANEIPGFPGSLGLPMILRTRERGYRPVLLPAWDAPESPLALAMAEGLSDREGQEILDTWALAGPDREAA